MRRCGGAVWCSVKPDRSGEDRKKNNREINLFSKKNFEKITAGNSAHDGFIFRKKCKVFPFEDKTVLRTTEIKHFCFIFKRKLKEFPFENKTVMCAKGKGFVSYDRRLLYNDLS